FLPVRPSTGEPALPLDLAVRDGRTDALHLRAKELLDRALDLDLVGACRHLENDGPAVLAQDRRLLRNERASNHVGEFHLLLSRGAPPPLANASRPLRAARLRPLAWPQALLTLSRGPTPSACRGSLIPLAALFATLLVAFAADGMAAGAS